MKVFIGANDRRQYCEAQSWTALLNSECFRNLEQWIKVKESDWGEAFVFIEIIIPLQEGRIPNTHSQIDLLICFNQRIALCEMKRYRFLRISEIGEDYEQITGECDWLYGLLRKARYDRPLIAPMFLFPYLNISNLDTIHRELLNKHHALQIWAVGMQSSMEHRIGDGGRPYHLVYALDSRLSGQGNDHNFRNDKLHVGKCIYQTISEVGSKLLGFDSFANAANYLNTLASASWSIMRNEWHIPNLLPDAITFLDSGLKQFGMVELIGPPGSGRSSIVQEFIGMHDEQPTEVYISGTRSRLEATKLIYDHFKGYVPPNVSEADLLFSLRDASTIFWLRECDQKSRPALLDFIAALEKAGKPKSRWIFESTEGILRDCQKQWKVKPFSDATIGSILENVLPGGEFADPEQIIERSQGNPARAVRLWRSKEYCSSLDSSSDIEWFRQQLSPEERGMLAVICHATTHSPFEVTFRLLLLWASSSHPDRSIKECEATLRSVLGKLDDQRLARFSELASLSRKECLNSVIPKTSQLSVLCYLATEVTEAVSVEKIEQRLGPNHERLHATLLENAPTDSLAFVTSALLQGDLEPFFRSSFRSTMLPYAAEWMDRTQRVPIDSRQAYLLRSLRILAQVGHRSDISIDELGSPAQNDATQQFVYEATRSRIMAYQPFAAARNFKDEWARAKDESDADLRCERLVSLARSLQHVARFQESWMVLRELPDLYRTPSASQLLSHMRLLEFLNRKEQRKRILSDEAVLQMIRGSCRKIIDYSATVENLQAICDSLFFFIRSHELARQAPSDAEVEAYGHVLDFTEQNRRRRARRLQILLTHGSLHRHACFSQGVQWERFRRHMDAAFIWCGRVFKSAQAQGHLQHKLQAICYMMDLCCKSMRFVNGSEKDEVLQSTKDRSSNILELIRSFPIVETTSWSRTEKSLHRDFTRSLPFMFYLEALNNEHCNIEEAGDLQESWKALSLMIKEESFSKRTTDTTFQRNKTIWNRITRSVRLGQQHNPARNRAALEAIRPSLLAVMEMTEPPENSSNRGDWQNAFKIVRGELSKPCN